MQQIQTGSNPYNLPAAATYNPYRNTLYTPTSGSASQPESTTMSVSDIYKIGENLTKLPDLYSKITGSTNVGGSINPSSYFSNLSNGTAPWLSPSGTGVINTGSSAIGLSDSFINASIDPASLASFPTAGAGAIPSGSGSSAIGLSGGFENVVVNPSSIASKPTSALSGSFANAAAGAAGAIGFDLVDDAFGWGGDREGQQVGAVIGGAAGSFFGPWGTAAGAFIGSFAGSFFGDDGDWPFARFSSTGGNVGIIDSLDGGPKDKIESLGNSAHGTLMAIVESTGINKDSLPTVALGVASGRKGSNLGSGFYTTIHDNGGFASKSENVNKWETAEEVAADYTLSSLKNADISGTSSSFQELVMSYDGTNGVELFGELSQKYGASQDFNQKSAGYNTGLGPRGKSKGTGWKKFHEEYKQKMQEGAA